MWSLLEEDFQQLGLTFSEAWNAAADVKQWTRRLDELQ
jgi:hypothetical protein